MNQLQEIFIIIDTSKEKPEVDVEFWRRNDHTEYNGISSSNFKRLCKALEDYQVVQVDARFHTMIVNYYIR